MIKETIVDRAGVEWVRDSDGTFRTRDYRLSGWSHQDVLDRRRSSCCCKEELEEVNRRLSEILALLKKVQS